MSACISLKFTISVATLQKNCRSIVSNGTSQFYNADKQELNSFLLVSYIIPNLMQALREARLVHYFIVQHKPV